jgi:hypothetical protein
MKLLSREQFKNNVFCRDNNCCIICGASEGIVAHHIIDRSLWEESGGYYLDNGVSLCASHHLDAERTVISCKTLRQKAGITNTIMPDHFFIEEEYDHWGNIQKPNGVRYKGGLFFEENVQRTLKEGGVLNDFSPWVKYPRTYHLPSSPNLQNDDRKHKHLNFFEGKTIIGTIKRDGENTSMYPDYYHARSLNSTHHESQSLVKAIHGSIAHDIPKDWRICGENLYAKHSIHYHNLTSYFEVFSIWNEKNIALNWEETMTYCVLLDLKAVPCFYIGSWNPDVIHQQFLDYCARSKDDVEGYVLRVSDEIPYGMFHKSTAKWVRENHVRTTKFWKSEKVIPNELKNE